MSHQKSSATSGDLLQHRRIINLRLPRLCGRSVLNVNCSDGLYCGYALFDQAQEVVGVDSCPAVIADAQRRYPCARFHLGDIHNLPPRQFDIIIATIKSGEHETQRSLVETLMSRLNQGGIICLEIMAPKPRPPQGNQMLTRPLSEDEQTFACYAWKLIGLHLAPDSGRPVVSYYHLRHKMPLVYLLLQPPGYGKTTIARSLFKDPSTPLVSLDKLLTDIANGHFTATEKLSVEITQGFHPHRINSTIDKLFAAGLEAELLQASISRSGGQDFALEGYIPASKVTSVRQAFSALGYVPIMLDWQPNWDLPTSISTSEQKLESYQQWLAMIAMLPPSANGKSLPGEVVGYLDDYLVVGNTLIVSGWVASRRGERINLLKVEVAGQLYWIDSFQRVTRPDVQKHLDHFDDELGFSCHVQLATGLEHSDVAKTLQVYAGGGPDMLHGPLAKGASLSLVTI